ncbi:hypothetical protein Bca101_090225 [Brassica carinata]
MKTKPKSKNFNLQPPPSTINLHIIDNYFRVLSDIHLGSDSVRIISITRNTIKQDPFGIYTGFGSVRIYFYRIGFGSGFRVRFICPALILVLC